MRQFRDIKMSGKNQNLYFSSRRSYMGSSSYRSTRRHILLQNIVESFSFLVNLISLMAWKLLYLVHINCSVIISDKNDRRLFSKDYASQLPIKNSMQNGRIEPLNKLRSWRTYTENERSHISIRPSVLTHPKTVELEGDQAISAIVSFPDWNLNTAAS